MNPNDLASTLTALSARTMALGAAVYALAGQQGVDHKHAVVLFDSFASELADRYVGLPVQEGFLDILQQSLDDIRNLLLA